MKAVFKSILHAIAFVPALPYLLGFWLMAVFVGKNRALEGTSQAVSLWPGFSGIYVRRAVLCAVLNSCDASCEVHFGTLFSQAGTIIDANAYIGPRCQIGLAHIGRDCLIASGVQIPSGAMTHAFDDPDIAIKDQGGMRTMVEIGAGAWIGSGAIVMANVGPGTIVAAGAVVTKPLPANVIAGGVPAKVIRPRFTTEVANTPPTPQA